MEGFPTTFPPPYGVVCAPAAGPIPTPGSVCWPRREARFVTPHGVNYLELCKAILGQAWPAPAARTRDCGVQVNAKVDKTVQCSLGPKTLLGSGERGEEEEDRDEDCPGGSSYKTPSVSQLRFFIRPVSIYSPVLERGFHMELAEKEARDEEKEHEQEGSKHPEQVHKATVHRANRGSNLQVYYKQLCRKCQVGFNPYRVESIICKGCSETCCSCEKKQRHINMTRPHRQDLCCRCRGTKLSCDATYSFKYIV
ncbi:zygote arrest protein 2.L isoform X5 [Syngnathus scovelli]|uniref:zygote arrest protein 2.L isoform X5 n=1 Tax=Syngnathus scovelli TaxID=161590 RepID=UPI00210F38DF|nr:zygote arrest protein 1 isoform X5 [Syngnathus scovelli]